LVKTQKVEMDEFASCGCYECGGKSHHIFIQQRCHPGARLSVEYITGGTVKVSCPECEKLVFEVQIR